MFKKISESISTLLEKEKVSLYCGADPSANSLHVGNLIPLIILLHFRARGHNPIALVGGATGIVGDPSGRKTERQQMEAATRSNNVANIRKQLETFLTRGEQYASKKGYPSSNFGKLQSTDNSNWWKNMGMLEFLGTYGRHIRVGQMLARDSVKSRMESEQGIGFNEFAYQILQAYDFWHLHSTQGCKVQVGGNDQWGNITAGIDLITRLRSELFRKEKERKDLLKKNKNDKEAVEKLEAERDPIFDTLPIPSKEFEPAYGITVPLLTTPSGEKFGKSAGNAVWIDPKLTKPYELYQYFVKAPDSIVEKYLKLFTFLPMESISKLMEEHVKAPEAFKAQKVLAKEVTDLVHGEGFGQESAIMSEILFPRNDSSTKSSGYNADTIISAFDRQDLVVRVPFKDIENVEWREFLSKLTGKSKTNISQLLKTNSVYTGAELNPVQEKVITKDQLIENKLLLIRVGKKSFHLVEATY